MLPTKIPRSDGQTTATATANTASTNPQHRRPSNSTSSVSSRHSLTSPFAVAPDEINVDVTEREENATTTATNNVDCCSNDESCSSHEEEEEDDTVSSDGEDNAPICDFNNPWQCFFSNVLMPTAHRHPQAGTPNTWSGLL